MYRSFYNLIQKPFMQVGDPAFFWIGGRRAAIFEEMYTCVLKNCGFLLVTGSEGLGKTATLQSLTRGLQGEVISGIIKGPFVDKIDLYMAIGRTFSMDREFTSKVQFLLYFGQFLHESEAKKKNVLLAVDDCHRLSQDLLEELRAISNIRHDEGSRLITIILAGEPEFLVRLDQPGNMTIRQQLSNECILEPLDPAEAGDYIAHRLKAAGRSEPLFSEDAIQSLCLYSAGKPSALNTLCERALILGAHGGKIVIDSQVIEDATEPANLARVPENIEKAATHGGKSRRRVPREIPKTDKTAKWLWSLFHKIQNGYGVRMWGGILLFAVLCTAIFSLPSLKESAPKPEGVQQAATENFSGSSPQAGGEEKAGGSSTSTRAVVDKKNGKVTDAAAAAKDFWQSRQGDSRLVKVDRGNIEDFITGFRQSPDTVFLLRSNEGTLTEKLVRDMQNLLVQQGIGPARVKVMKSEDQDLVEGIAGIARLEGHKVLEVIVVQDGIWWGELDGKTN